MCTFSALLFWRESPKKGGPKTLPHASICELCGNRGALASLKIVRGRVRHYRFTMVSIRIDTLFGLFGRGIIDCVFRPECCHFPFESR